MLTIYSSGSPRARKMQNPAHGNYVELSNSSPPAYSYVPKEIKNRLKRLSNTHKIGGVQPLFFEVLRVVFIPCFLFYRKRLMSVKGVWRNKKTASHPVRDKSLLVTAAHPH